MYVFLYLLIIMISNNCLCTIALTSSSTNNRITRNLKRIVDTALQQDASDDINNELLIEQLSRILEQEEGLRIVERKQRSIYSIDDDDRRIFDGSGDILEDEDLPPIYSNMSIIAFTMGSTTTAVAKYTPKVSSKCPCEKGERGLKGDAGICPADCNGRIDTNTNTKDCVGSQINLERLAESVRQLILDTKKIAYRNAKATSCTCPTLPSTTTTVSPLSTQFTLDYNTYTRLKGEKGDPGDTGTSCSPACMQPTQPSVRVFKTLQEATDASHNYPDHTYVHIVNDRGYLQGVYIRSRGRLIPLRIENEKSYLIRQSTLPPPTTLSIPPPLCRVTLPCPTLHMFALGPHIRRMCSTRRGTMDCSKLADYDDLCSDVSQRHQLRGYYRAFMSTSTQWLSNLFAGICVSAKIINMHGQTLFDSVGEIFEQKPPQNEIFDVQGLRPQFQYWWHGTLINGTASSDTCHDWSRQDSSLSGMASRMPDGVNGLFHHQYTWPCSIGDSNMGIICIETNCDRNNYYKH